MTTVKGLILPNLGLMFEYVCFFHICVWIGFVVLKAFTYKKSLKCAVITGYGCPCAADKMFKPSYYLLIVQWIGVTWQWSFTVLHRMVWYLDSADVIVTIITRPDGEFF